MFTVEGFVANERTPTVNGEPTASQHVVNAEQVAGVRFDPGLLRPYTENGEIWVDVTHGYEAATNEDGSPALNHNGMPVMRPIIEPQLVRERQARGLPVCNGMYVNNATTLRKDQWIMIDSLVRESIQARLRAYADLRAANTMGGFDGMATTILERELATDPGEAFADMDGLSEGRNFAHKFALQGLPLPITHSDFFIPSRFLAQSRAKGGPPADTMRIRAASRRCAELVEKTTIGVVTGPTYGLSTDYLQTSKVYGYLNHPARTTKTDMTTPTGANPDVILTDLLQARELMYAKNIYGPFVWYHSTDYDQYLDNDYWAGDEADGPVAPSRTLRQRILQIEGISAVRRLDYLPSDTHPFTSVLVDMSRDNDYVQAINGLEFTTVQWESKGGMQLNFKVMGIQVPYIKSAFLSGTTTETTGIVHCTTS